MAEKIVSQRVVSRRVVGSSNPIARKFRNFKGSFGGLCIAPLLLIIAFGLIFYSEKFKRSSAVVEQLNLETADEVTADSGLHKMSGKVVVVEPISAPELGNVLYYSYREQKYEEVEEVETDTVTTFENGQEIEETIETTKLVEKWVDKNTGSEWAEFKVGNYTIKPSGANLKLNLSTKEYMKQYAAAKDYQQVCTVNGGTWVSAYSECEGLSQAVCDANGGTYNDCASDCRHELDMTTCLDVCVELCDFKSYGEYVEVKSGQSVSPDLGDYRIVVDYLPVESDILVVGEISGSSVSGGDTFIVTNKTDAELLNDLKTSETTAYWLMKAGALVLLTLGILMILSPILSLLDFIPVAGKAASCVATVIALLVSLAIVVSGTLVIKYWFVCIALAVIGVAILVVLLLVLLAKSGGDDKKDTEEKDK